jgi:hypothetical protein
MSRLLAAAPGSPAIAGIAGDQPAIPVAPSGIDVDVASGLLESVGFLLVPGAPFGHGTAYLMVALRPKPTLAHFDPERIEYWTTERERPTRATLEWPIAAVDGSYTWGLITTVDRVPARNEFASFGGRLTTARDGERHAALFRSDAPILSVGGHSGDADPLGVHLAGHFASLRAAAGDAAIAHKINAVSPLALYAAFIVRTLATFQARSASGASAPRISAVLRSEIRRLELDHPSDFGDGLDIDSMI